MANVRIKDLTTTAATTASDDFFGVDGATNGTRKLNAYSPTFGGNLTLSGATSTITLGSTNTGSIAVDANGALIVTPKAGQYTTLSVSGNSGFFVNNGTTQIYLGNSGGNAVAGTLNANDFLLIRDGAVKLTATATGVDITGNLSVSGTGTSSVAGNLGIGTTSPSKKVEIGLPNTSDNGLLLAAYSSTSSNTASVNLSMSSSNTLGTLSPTGINWQFGDIRFGGVNSSLSRAVSAIIRSEQDDNAGATYNAGRLLFLTGTSSAAPVEQARITSGGNVLIGTTTDGGQKLQVNGTAAFAGDLLISTNSVINFTVHDAYLRSAGGKSIFLQPAGTTALTLDSSQNAKFAGNINAGGANNDVDIRLHLNAAGDTSAKYAALWRNASSNKIFHLRADGDLYTSAGATITGALAIGNTVQTAVGVASTHKVTISIGGTTYYLLATNV